MVEDGLRASNSAGPRLVLVGTRDPGDHRCSPQVPVSGLLKWSEVISAYVLSLQVWHQRISTCVEEEKSETGIDGSGRQSAEDLARKSALTGGEEGGVTAKCGRTVSGQLLKGTGCLERTAMVHELFT